MGVPAGLTDGGILDWERREVTVRALPQDMPEALELDVSGLVIGHHLTVADVSAPAGVNIIDDPETVLCRSRPAAGRAADCRRVAEEAAEPEVIGGEPSEE